jgi:hypothetical protein
VVDRLSLKAYMQFDDAGLKQCKARKPIKRIDV